MGKSDDVMLFLGWSNFLSDFEENKIGGPPFFIIFFFFFCLLDFVLVRFLISFSFFNPFIQSFAPQNTKVTHICLVHKTFKHKSWAIIVLWYKNRKRVESTNSMTNQY